jgi:hypothetical protein
MAWASRKGGDRVGVGPPLPCHPTFYWLKHTITKHYDTGYICFELRQLGILVNANF